MQQTVLEKKKENILLFPAHPDLCALLLSREKEQLQRDAGQFLFLFFLFLDYISFISDVIS